MTPDARRANEADYRSLTRIGFAATAPPSELLSWNTVGVIVRLNGEDEERDRSSEQAAVEQEPLLTQAEKKGIARLPVNRSHAEKRAAARVRLVAA